MDVHFFRSNLLARPGIGGTRPGDSWTDSQNYVRSMAGPYLCESYKVLPFRRSESVEGL